MNIAEGGTFLSREHILIGVIGTEMHGIEQQRILQGIMKQAQAEQADVAVLSNIFNPLEPEQAECCENRIYELLLSPDLDAVIVLSESFVNAALRNKIGELLQRTEIPVLLVGAAFFGYDFPCISTSDANDIAEITSHLIDGHGFRDIALLTGPLSLKISRSRISGYRSALEAHGIPYDEKKVYAGDFWYHSGEQLAKAFLGGEEPMPEALVCANDYMAFGVLDAFEYAGINMLDRMALIGYEFIPERHLHTPLLTTYQRNREGLGQTAVQMILRQLRGEPEMPFEPPRGRLIHGVTCSCNVSRIRQHEELVSARLAKQYADWNLKSEMERLLTECTDMDTFAEAMGKFMFLLRGVSDIWLCLFEDWHREQPVSDVLLCRSVAPWKDHTVIRLKKEKLSGLTERDSESCTYYWLPVCFRDRMFGYCVLRYDHPESFDDVCRNWMKSVANGLEFLRLKADVRYLLQCRVLSGAYDSMTGMFSREGLKQACHLMQSTGGAEGVAGLLVRCFPEHGILYSADDAKPVVERILAAAKAVQRFQGGICGRISEYEFLLLFPAERCAPELICCAVTAELLRVLPVGAFLCTAECFPKETQPDALLNSLTAAADSLAAEYKERRMLPHYAELSAIRTAVYQQPAEPHGLSSYAAGLGFNPDYFNRKYKACFGLSFHQDCIRSRVLYAAYLLQRTSMGTAETAECCGYTESKYFIRQFSAVTGCPPKAFRSAAGILSDGGAGFHHKS